MGQLCCGLKGSDKQQNIVIFLSSVRPGRMADRVGKYVKDKVESTGMNTTIIDPMEIMFDITEADFDPTTCKENTPDWLKDTTDSIRLADGYIIISAEYNSSIPPALLNILSNCAPSAFYSRPCGLITYSVGACGGIRAQTLLPIVLSELWILPVPTRVSIPNVQDNFTEAGICLDKRVTSNIEIMIQEVQWYADAIKTQKKIRLLDEMGHYH